MGEIPLDKCSLGRAFQSIKKEGIFPSFYQLPIDAYAADGAAFLDDLVFGDIFHVDKMFEHDFGIIADAFFAFFIRVDVAQLAVDRLKKNLVAHDLVVLVFHGLDTHEQVGFEGDCGGVVVEGGFEQVDRDGGDLVFHLGIAVQGRGVYDLVHLAAFAVDNAGILVEREEVAVDRERIHLILPANPALDHVRLDLLGQVDVDRQPPHNVQLGFDILDQPIVNGGVFLTGHRVVEHRDGKARVAALEDRDNPVDDAFVVVGELEVAVNLHVLGAVEGNRSLNREVFAAGNGHLVELLELGQLIGDRVDRHDVVFRPDRLDCGRDRCQQADFGRDFRFGYFK